MAFPIDEKVITHYCAGDPLVNGESHFAASFGGLWFINCNCNFLTVQTDPMAHTKQTKWRSESNMPNMPRQPSKWGTAAKGATHRPQALPVRPGTSGNPSYKGMPSMYSL